MSTVLLTPGGLSLRPLAGADIGDLHALWTAPGVRRYLWDDEVIPFDRTASSVATSERLFAAEGLGLWGARDTGDVRLLGFAGFWHFRDPPELELLYGVAEGHWGRGYATEIAAAIVRYGHDTLAMPLIRASTDAGNVASTRVLEKLGFRFTRRAAVRGLDTLFYEREANR